MKALPARFEQRVYPAKSDPDGIVSYSITPLNNQLRMYIQSLNVEIVAEDVVVCPACGKESDVTFRFNGGGTSYDAVGFALDDITGLEGFEIVTEDIKIGRTVYKRLTDDCMTTIPGTLYDEIHLAVGSARQITEAEKENMDFTLDSSTVETSQTVQETSQPVPVEDSNTKSEKESQPTDADNPSLSQDASGNT